MRFTLLLLLVFAYSCKSPGEEGSNSNSALNETIDRYRQNQSIEAASAVLKEVANSKNDSISRYYIAEAASEFYSYDDLQSFFQTNKILMERADEARDTVALAKSFRYQAEYYQSTSKIDSAFQMLKAAEKLYTRLNDQYNLGKVIYKKAILQYRASDLLGADLSMTQALSFLKSSDDDQFIYQTLSMTGIIATSLEDYEKALEYHHRALQFAQDRELDRSLNQIESTLNNIGGVLQLLNRDKEAINNFKDALKGKSNLKSNPGLYAMLLDNLGYSKMKVGQMDGVSQLFEEALEIRDSLRLDSYSIISRNHLSEYYALKRDSLKAAEYASDALLIAERTNSPTDKLIVLKQLSAVDPQKGSEYSQEYIRINDSLKQAERKSRDKFARLELETNQIASENDKLAEQNRTLLYFFFGTLTFGFLLFIIRAQRAKNRELLLKQAQQKANEDIYNLMINQQTEIEKSRLKEKRRIAQELHDGILGRLFGTRLNLDSLNKGQDTESAEKRTRYLSELKNIEQDIREISHDLSREKNSVINNFTSILTNLVEEQQNISAGELHLQIDESINWDTLPNNFKINAYRIIQESLQNINKYANAEIVNIKIRHTNNFIKIIVEDNGVGFDSNTKRKGIGLKNILSRANELGGTLDIRSKKGKGTSIIVTVPSKP